MKKLDIIILTIVGNVALVVKKLRDNLIKQAAYPRDQLNDPSTRKYK